MLADIEDASTKNSLMSSEIGGKSRMAYMSKLGISSKVLF
jgi:hypothetical protein